MAGWAERAVREESTLTPPELRPGTRNVGGHASTYDCAGAVGWSVNPNHRCANVPRLATGWQHRFHQGGVAEGRCGTRRKPTPAARVWGLAPPGQGVSPPDTPRPGGAPWTPLRGGQGGRGGSAPRTADRPHPAPQSGPVVIIGGPTASGKSGLALDLARTLGGRVINADSRQLYADLTILTARPGPAACALVPHQLYGVLPADETASAARWRDWALAEITACHRTAALPIVVGGTGLYLRALIEGLAPVPAVPPEVRQAAEDTWQRLGGAGLRAALARHDPETAARLAPGDRHRLIRAWEVWTATGRPLSAFRRSAPDGPPAGLRFHLVTVLPPRAELYAACDGRFAAMVAAGALDEVAALRTRDLDSARPVMTALGVPELMRHLNGDLTLAEAVALAQQSTRRYAKRQSTWFRHQVIARHPGQVWRARYETAHGQALVTAVQGELADANTTPQSGH